MAGESRGELAEAIAKVAVEDALHKLRSRELVFWEVRPDVAAITPDITTGTSKDNVSNVILVNASDTARNSDIKYWRNIGEIFDCKTRLDPPPATIALFFKSEIKPELIRLTSELCDASHLVDRDPTHGAAIASWLEAHHATAPSKTGEKEELVRRALDAKDKRFAPEFTEAFRNLVGFLSRNLFHQRNDLKPLWQLARADFLSRRANRSREARVTLLRRGIARWLVLDDKTRSAVLDAHYRGRSIPTDKVPPYATLLGLLTLSIAGAVIPSSSTGRQDMVGTAGSDLRLAAQFFRDAAQGDAARARNTLESALATIPDEMRRIAARLREVPAYVEGWQRYSIANWKKLTTASGLLDELTRCAADRTMGAQVKVPDSYESNWLYEHLIAVLRANAGRNNDFGYGALVAYFKARSFEKSFLAFLKSASGVLGERWIKETLPRSAEPGRRGFQDWLVGKKDVSRAVIAAFSFALSAKLLEVKCVAEVKLPDLVAAHSYGIWNKLLTYQDFEPLPAIVTAACGGKVVRVAARTVMADLANRAVQDAGSMPALAFSGGLICWKSATDAGKDHKRKELAGRARALRFTKDVRGFHVRSGAQKLLLVVDGTFNTEDLKVLAQSGWDEIFYPDEMDKLIKVIV
jgi:hypothetical protein